MIPQQVERKWPVQRVNAQLFKYHDVTDLIKPMPELPVEVQIVRVLVVAIVVVAMCFTIVRIVR